MNPNSLDDTRQYWDDQAASFDDEPDHGLRDPLVRQAWAERLRAWLPEPPAAVLDIGCGTGSLSLLAAELGHRVTAIDLSPEMIARAEGKALAQGLEIELHVMDAAHPHLPYRLFDALLCRHLLWALPEPALVLQRWSRLLRPGGRLVLVEGLWQTGSGLHASEVTALLPPAFTSVTVDDLSPDAHLWGRPVTDERYAVIAVLGGSDNAI